MIALGGTIASASDGRGGVLPNLDADALLAAVPGLDDSDIDVTTSTFRSVSSATLTLDDLAELSDLIAEETRDHTGVVVTQGTDTLEETAFYLDLVTDPGVPVVVTGAMRNPTLAGPDGPANLLAAIQVAADDQAWGLGCLVVFNDEIHAARSVRKTHTTSTSAFVSPDAGPLGRISENVPRVHRLLSPTSTIRDIAPAAPANVAVVTTYLGDDGGLLDAVDDRYQGVVIAGLGGGHVPRPLLDGLDRLVARMPVVIASRTGAGPILRSTYSFPGSDRDLADRGLISAGSLDPYKSRILLHLLLASGADTPAVEQMFQQLNGS